MFDEELEEFNFAYQDAMFMNQLYVTFCNAFFSAISEMGLEEFKKCSFFGSNESKE